jgi:predicted HAD superfamily Cof-like phosphohydrolase
MPNPREPYTAPRLHELDVALDTCRHCRCTLETAPTSCPGLPVADAQQESVRRGERDYFRGRWWLLGPEVSDFHAVGEFHEKFKLRNATHYMPNPQPLTAEELQFRTKFILEEFNEDLEACGLFLEGFNEWRDTYTSGKEIKVEGFEAYDPGKVDLAKAADALVDLAYVVLGTAHLHRLPWQELFAEVQRANMSKERCGIDHTFQACDVPACNCQNCHHLIGLEKCGQAKAAHSLRGSALDVIKPVGWVAPDIEGVLRRNGWSGDAGKK